MLSQVLCFILGGVIGGVVSMITLSLFVINKGDKD